MTILFGTTDAGLQLRATEANSHRLRTIIRETAQVENLCYERSEGLPVPGSRRCWPAQAGCRTAASIE
jgi:hypothetical protein